MRVAVYPIAEAGIRAGRILLGDPHLTELGMYRRSLRNPDDPRARSIEDLEGFDALVTDETDHPLDVASWALAAGVSCALWSDLWRQRDEARRLGEEFAAAGLTLLVGASLGSGIAAALVSHELARTDEALEAKVAWTVPGRPLRRGEAIPFPKPVGPRWGKEVDDDDQPSTVPTRRFVAPVSGDWAGAVVRLTGLLHDGVAQRVVGVADHAGHLEGLALAAGALSVAAGAFAPGLQWPASEPEYLNRALEAGLTVATFTIEESSRDRS